MKRLCAAGIDVILYLVISSCVKAVIVGKSGMTINERTTQLMIGEMFFWFYSFICDYFFMGITIGKYVMGIQVFNNYQKIRSLKFAFLHSLSREFFHIFGWMGLIIFICMKYQMPYDKWLGIHVIERRKK